MLPLSLIEHLVHAAFLLVHRLWVYLAHSSAGLHTSCSFGWVNNGGGVAAPLPNWSYSLR